MKPLILVAALAFCAGCNSGDKKNTEVPKADTTAPPPPTTPPPGVEMTPTGKIDIESFGDIKLGQQHDELLKVLGEPEAKADTKEWAADGLMHENWIWEKKGLLIGMSWDKTKAEAAKAVFSITARAPCAFKTRAGIGIGSTYAEVQEAYKKDIDTEATDKTQITVGSVYGGIIFSFEKDKVSNIFLGAAAE